MNRAAGLTLVEVLVALMLALVVLTGSLVFVARGREAQRVGESLARLEEQIDAALVMLVEEIRVAGYLGLAPPASAVVGASAAGTVEHAGLEVGGACVSSLAHDLAVPVAAVDGAYEAAPGLPLGCRASPGGRAIPGSDVLILRHAAAEASRPEPGRLQLETNLRTARLAADGRGMLGADARWHDLEVSVLYVSADSTGHGGWPSLRRKRLVGGTRPAFQDEELVSGIADLQIEIGLDDPADADTAIDRWITPDAAPHAGVPRALRLQVEAQSDIAEPSQPGGSRRKRVTRVVELRNSGPQT
ncbi:MAG: PilW family protein [Steroidobacteraceae bacterium]